MIVLEIKFFGDSDEVLEGEALRDGTSALTEGTPERVLLTRTRERQKKHNNNKTG